MRVLVWCPFVNLGGGIRLLSSLMTSLARHPEIDELALVIPPEAASAFANAPDTLKLHLVPKPALLRWLENPDNSSDLGRLSKKILRRLLPNYRARLENRYLARYAQTCDLIYVFWPHGIPILATTKPIVCTYQDTTVLDFPEILGGLRTELERRYALSWVSQADQLVTSSQTVRANLIRYFGERGTRASVIYHNILPQAASASAASAEATLEKLPALPERYLVYAANVNVHKNHDTLLTAWSRFADRAELPLVLLGEYTHILRPDWQLGRNHYWLHDHLVGVVQRQKLEHGRDYYALGYVPDDQMAHIMRGAAAVIMASLSEGGGSFPAEEALSYGVPLLCADIPVMHEHLAARSAVVLWFDPLSPDSILAALYQLHDDYDRYAASAQSGMNDPRPSWDDVADQYVQVFKRALL